MKIWIVFTEDNDLDPYEGKTWAYTDSVWSTQQKARSRIKELCDLWMAQNNHPEECKNCSCSCESGHDCFYSNLVIPGENMIVINVDSMTQKVFFIEEHLLDEVKDGA